MKRRPARRGPDIEPGRRIDRIGSRAPSPILANEKVVHCRPPGRRISVVLKELYYGDRQRGEREAAQSRNEPPVVTATVIQVVFRLRHWPPPASD